MKITPTILATLLSAAVLTGQAATILFDFETATAAKELPYRKQGATTLDIVTEYATSGARSLRFQSPAWKEGMPEWPAFNLIPEMVDWRGYDRLVMDVTNPEAGAQRMMIFITDKHVPFREGLSANLIFSTAGFKRFVVPLSKFPDKIKRSEIALIHVFTERPESDMALHIDNITLLKKGEEPAEPQASFVKQLLPPARRAIEAADRELAKLKASLAHYGTGNAAITLQTDRWMARLSATFDEGRKILTEDTPPTAGQLDALQMGAAALSMKSRRLEAQLKALHESARAGYAVAPMVVGTASAMEQLMPRDAPFELEVARAPEISLARNEYESLQVGVLAVGTDLKQVSLKAGDLKSASGATLPASSIACEVMGYVQTLQAPPYKCDYVGWWPNPILDFLESVEIADGTLQSFWVRVRAPRDQAPGLYSGELKVTAANAPETTLKLKVCVYDFTLPDASPLPLAITFRPEVSAMEDGKRKALQQSPDFPVNAWKRHRSRWTDFLADYYITLDSLYHSTEPDFEMLERLQSQGRLGEFNLGYWHYFNDNDEARENWRQKTLGRLRKAYDKARDLNMLDKAYIYGCDEISAKHFPRVEEAAALIRAACPGVPIMTTTYDHSYGQDSVIRSMDYFCPLTPRYDAALAKKARADNRQVWWYICCGPHRPYANMFIECPAIEGRLLMGAMTAKERPDGFLYYQISIWNAEKPITDGPFTDWPARSWTTYHGDGAWTCVGPDGVPLPTQRLENFRDGLDDYAYVRLLEQRLALASSPGGASPPPSARAREALASSPGGASPPPSAWAREAREALGVPAGLVTSMREYSRDPKQLYAWRSLLADLIERAPVKEALR